MGARANKVLGFWADTLSTVRATPRACAGVSGDQEDKEWLASRNLMPASGGKAYLMILDDICELTVADE